MLKKISTLILLFVMSSLLVNAQETQGLKPLGSALIKKSQLEAMTVKSKGKNVPVARKNVNPVNNVQGTIDTLSYRQMYPTASWNTNFGMFGQDVMVQWYEAPADLIIKQVGYAASDNVNNTPITVKIMKVTWSKDQLSSLPVARWGYFPSANAQGFGIQPFEQDATGPWQSTREGSTPFLGEDLWSDGGQGAPTTPVPSDNSADPVYQWVSMDILGLEPEVKRGEIFALVFENLSTNLGQGATDDRIGFFSSGNIPSNFGFKYYEAGRTNLDSTTAGWWSREYTWDMVAIVDLTGDRPPVIENITPLSTTLSTSPREVSATVTDDNPSGGAAGVASAVLQYSLDEGANWTDVAMTASGDTYTASIPGASPGQRVDYRIKATDVGGLETVTAAFNYSIFQKVHDVLLVYNASDLANASASYYYLGAYEPHHDFWPVADFGSGEVATVMALYNYVIQIDGSYPEADLSDAVATYLGGSSSSTPRNYFLSSQDYGCIYTGDCADVTFAAGTWQHDKLGITGIINQDMASASELASPMELVPAAQDPLSGAFAQYLQDSSFVKFYYNPSYELGATFNNYMDEIQVGAATPFMTAKDGGTDRVVGVHHMGDGFHTAYLSYDYLATDFLSDTTISEDDDTHYMWSLNVTNQALDFLTWAGHVVGVERENDLTPTDYDLSQNYPNPFNPNTQIKFAIPQASKVSLKIFDVLGREVATLLNEEKAAGNYVVDFNAAGLASGVYVYTLSTGSYSISKKMMLMK